MQMSNGGPFRGTRSTKKQTTATESANVEQSAPARRHQVVEHSEELEDEAMKPVEQQQPVAHVAQHHAVPAGTPSQHPKKRTGIFLIITGILVLGLFIAGIAWLVSQGGRTAIDNSKYQAIWLTNGQYYFGKLQILNRDYVRLTDVFYLQDKTAGTNDEAKQNTSENQNNLELVKLGNELHGPEDEMVVAKDQLLFYENLKTDGKVAQSIAQYKASGQ